MQPNPGKKTRGRRGWVFVAAHADWRETRSSSLESLARAGLKVSVQGSSMMQEFSNGCCMKHSLDVMVETLPPPAHPCSKATSEKMTPDISVEHYRFHFLKLHRCIVLATKCTTCTCIHVLVRRKDSFYKLVIIV